MSNVQCQREPRSSRREEALIYPQKNNEPPHVGCYKLNEHFCRKRRLPSEAILGKFFNMHLNTNDGKIEVQLIMEDQR
jgi:hypothetical protein